MEKYKSFGAIRKSDIQHFSGLEGEEFFTPRWSMGILPMQISKMGITHPDPNYRIQRHPATLYILEYVVSGSGYLEVNGEKHKISAGDAYLILPGDNCEYYSDPDDPYEKYWINFSAQFFFAEFLKAYGVTDRVIKNYDLSECFKEIFALEEISAFNDDLYLYISKIIYNLCLDLAIRKKQVQRENKTNIAYSIKYELHSSILIPISISDIAGRFYRSTNDIISIFKKTYGVTPYAYLIMLRIAFAKNLLINTSDSVSSIAERLCFSSPYHFSKIFKEKEGVSPREFRNAHKTKKITYATTD